MTDAMVQSRGLLQEARTPASSPRPNVVDARPEVRGKFLFVGEEKLWVRGVTYGTFAPGPDGSQLPARGAAAADLAAMAQSGFNTVRVYTPPPRWFLDLAALNGLRVMVGLPWEQHLAFLDSPARAASIVERVCAAVRELAAHPAVLCYAIGNEIPAGVVRWYGARLVERFLRRLTEAVRREDPTALVTYVNYPTTEYLDLSFCDFLSFNVYLESRESLRAYLARLQNLAGEKPLLMAEVGLDSRRNGELQQANTLSWQIETSFEMGAAGAIIFAWTDEWHRGGHDIVDWDFGLTGRDRRPKAALSAVADAFAEAPFPSERAWPRVSVVVCSFNGAVTIGETLQALEKLDYPDYEVIVVDDGSTDATGEIARGFNVRLIQTVNRGLSAARNTGMDAATGEIIAYTDDDAFPDPDWLKFLVAAFQRTDHDAIGGPNIAPPTDGDVAECIANAPGGPIHVLLGDELAEHIPGCNMAYRAEALRAVGGFDRQFRVAGDDVDVCWRVQERGGTLGFCAAAMVWHHRRRSVRAYLKQQRGYARAEALLADKWPEKYNSAGHLSWSGRLYGRGLLQSLFSNQRIYHGQYGTALFQSVYQRAPGLLTSLPLMPEWFFLVSCAALLGLLGATWPPLFWCGALAVIGLLMSLVQAWRAGLNAQFNRRGPDGLWRLRLLVMALHLLQPLARLQGRIQHGLGPWRWRGLTVSPIPRARAIGLWSETWAAPETRVRRIEQELRRLKARVGPGGDFDDWDLQVRVGLFGAARLRGLVEEHGAGRQLFRVSAWPTPPAAALTLMVAVAVLASGAAFDGAWLAWAVLAAASLTLAGLIYTACTLAMRQVADAVAAYSDAEGLKPVP